MFTGGLCRLGGMTDHVAFRHSSKGMNMKKACVFGSFVMVGAMVCMSAYGQEPRGDIRTGDTTIGDIRTGDISHQTHVHVTTPPDRYGRPGMYGRGQIGLALGGAYVPSFSGELRVLGQRVDDVDFAQVFGGGGALVFLIGEMGRIDIGADYLPMKLRDDSRVKIQMIPVTASIRLGAPVTDALFIYGGGGGGYSFDRFKAPADPEFGDPAVSESGGDIVYFACGGVEIRFTNELGLRGEGRYYWHKYEIFDDIEVVLNHFQARVGVTLWF